LGEFGRKKYIFRKLHLYNALQWIKHFPKLFVALKCTSESLGKMPTLRSHCQILNLKVRGGPRNLHLYQAPARVDAASLHTKLRKALTSYVS
jgi:hypothetical protein